jgi:hypothetical protein
MPRHTAASPAPLMCTGLAPRPRPLRVRIATQPTPAALQRDTRRDQFAVDAARDRQRPGQPAWPASAMSFTATAARTQPARAASNTSPRAGDAAGAFYSASRSARRYRTPRP